MENRGFESGDGTFSLATDHVYPMLPKKIFPPHGAGSPSRWHHLVFPCRQFGEQSDCLAWTVRGEVLALPRIRMQVEEERLAAFNPNQLQVEISNGCDGTSPPEQALVGAVGSLRAKPGIEIDPVEADLIPVGDRNGSGHEIKGAHRMLDRSGLQGGGPTDEAGYANPTFELGTFHAPPRSVV